MHKLSNEFQRGATLLEMMIVVTILGIMVGFSGMAASWFQGGMQIEQSSQAAYFVSQLLEQSRKYERQMGRTVFLSWKTNSERRGGYIEKFYLYRDENLNSRLDIAGNRDDYLIEEIDMIQLFYRARVYPQAGISTPDYINFFRGPRVALVSNMMSFWVVRKAWAESSMDFNSLRNKAEYRIAISGLMGAGVNIYNRADDQFDD